MSSLPRWDGNLPRRIHWWEKDKFFFYKYIFLHNKKWITLNPVLIATVVVAVVLVVVIVPALVVAVAHMNKKLGNSLK